MAGIYVRACCGTSVNRYFAHTQYIHEMYELYGEVCCAVVSVDRFCKRTYIYFLRRGTSITLGFLSYSAGWSSLVARRAHNPEVVGSSPAPATI